MEIVTIKGIPVIEIYESYDGSYWYITEQSHKQDGESPLPGFYRILDEDITNGKYTIAFEVVR